MVHRLNEKQADPGHHFKARERVMKKLVDWFVGRMRGMKKVELKYRILVWGFHIFIFAFLLFIMIAFHSPYPAVYVTVCVLFFLIIFPLSFLFGSVKSIEDSEKKDEDKKREFLEDVDKSLDDLSDWYIHDVETHGEYTSYFTPEMRKTLIEKLISKLSKL
jgi:hypothetical protein